MKTTTALFKSTPLARKLGNCLAATATVAMIALATASLSTPAYARPGREHGERGDLEELGRLLHKAQVEELLQLATDFHGALSYNGDPATKSAHLTAMSNLWVTDSIVTLSNTVSGVVSTYNGKDAVMSFIASSGYFLNNWVSLAPEYKTFVTVHGDTGHISTQCVATDLTVSPMVIRGVIQVEADVVRHHDKWLFKAMHNYTPAPL
jgi:hypothetical protein